MTILHYNHTKADIMDLMEIMAILFDIAQYSNPFGASSPKSEHRPSRIGENRIGENRVRENRIGENRIGENRIGENRIGENRIGENRICWIGQH